MNLEPEQNEPKEQPAQPATQPQPQPLINALIAASDPPTKTDLSAAVLELALRHEADERKTERFFWITGGIVMFDALVCAINVWSLAGLVPIELIILIGLAHWLEVDFVKKPAIVHLNGPNNHAI